MNSRTLLLILLLIVTGCKKDTITPDNTPGSTCGVTNPVENLSWLKQEIAAVSGPSTYADYYATRAIYKGSEIFWISICCPACNTIPPTLKYCDGSPAGMLTTDIQTNELSGVTMLWRTENGICVID